MQYGPGLGQPESAGDEGQYLRPVLISVLGFGDAGDTMADLCIELVFFSGVRQGKGGSLGFTGLIKVDGVYGGVHGWTIPRVSTRQVAPTYELFPLKFGKANADR